MARVVIVGGGLGGMAVAARLAKLGHRVILLEATERLGGCIGAVERDGFGWQAGPSRFWVPAVVRDLFRKSGRAVEREVELVPVEPAQQHRFEDGTNLTWPTGSRAEQLHAVADALGADRGAAWVSYVDAYAPVWEALRRDLFERPWSAGHARPETRRLLQERTSLHRHVRASLRDDRLRRLAWLPTVLEGHRPRDVPAWFGMWSYLEQTFGTWTAVGGMSALADALTARLGTRGVNVLCRTAVRDLVIREGRVAGVLTSEGTVDADLVVVATDPRTLPALAVHVRHAMPAMPPVITHLGVVGEVDELAPEVVLHTDPLVLLRTDAGTAPEGAHAWTALARGRTGEDVLAVLARAGIGVHDRVRVRVDVSPRDQVERWHGSPYGVLWQGRGSWRRRLGPRTPLNGVYLAGAHSPLGAGVAPVGLSAALVAQLVGPA